MISHARLRADINIRESASANAEIVERLPANSLFEILEDHGEWQKIKVVRIKKAPSGFIPKLGLIFPPGLKAEIFPILQLDDGTRCTPSVPPNVLLRDFQSWLNTEAMPTWLSEADWNQLGGDEQAQIIQAKKFR